MSENLKSVSVLELLLKPELPDVRKVLPEKQVEVPRLSELAGTPMVFTLRGLSYDQVRQVQEKPRSDQAAFGVLYGCVSPKWGDAALLDKTRGIATPVDAIKARLIPGEIDELYMEIQQLSGYLRRTLGEVKNG
ncbi:phage tail assembly chaperone [Oscillibacter sp.]|uniref:phage tail assembly chaperone n=1 Tax=Oscillibacter sp. TaxID=1945593 RepID=UPI00289F7D6A|nr:hypothetical protein [Oscillibacter sp.]